MHCLLLRIIFINILIFCDTLNTVRLFLFSETLRLAMRSYNPFSMKVRPLEALDRSLIKVYFYTVYIYIYIYIYVYIFKFKRKIGTLTGILTSRSLAWSSTIRAVLVQLNGMLCRRCELWHYLSSFDPRTNFVDYLFILIFLNRTG